MNFLASIFGNSTTQIIMAVIGLAAGLWAYIAKLRSEITQHQNTIAVLQDQAQNKEFQDQIREVTKNVAETIKDYNQSVSDFESKYGNGRPGSKPNS